MEAVVYDEGDTCTSIANRGCFLWKTRYDLRGDLLASRPRCIRLGGLVRSEVAETVARGIIEKATRRLEGTKAAVGALWRFALQVTTMRIERL